MNKRKYLNLRIWSLLGLSLSMYTTYVELKTEENNDYKALCDFSERISCTKAFASRYGKSFGIVGSFLGDESHWNPPNGTIGIIFYSLLFLSAKSKNRLVVILQILACFLANMMSIYLAYLLFYVLDDLCLVCVTVYFINFICLLERYNNYHEKWCQEATKIVNSKLNKND